MKVGGLVATDSTWCSKRQAVVQTSGFGGDKQVTEDAQSDDEGKEDHSCYRETHKSSEAGMRHRKQQKNINNIRRLVDKILHRIQRGNITSAVWVYSLRVLFFSFKMTQIQHAGVKEHYS